MIVPSRGDSLGGPSNERSTCCRDRPRPYQKRCIRFPCCTSTRTLTENNLKLPSKHWSCGPKYVSAVRSDVLETRLEWEYSWLLWWCQRRSLNDSYMSRESHCQRCVYFLCDEGRCSELMRQFFVRYSSWKWPEPVYLLHTPPKQISDFDEVVCEWRAESVGRCGPKTESAMTSFQSSLLPILLWIVVLVSLKARSASFFKRWSEAKKSQIRSLRDRKYTHNRTCLITVLDLVDPLWGLDLLWGLQALPDGHNCLEGAPTTSWMEGSLS